MFLESVEGLFKCRPGLAQGDDGRSKHGFPKIFDLNLPVLHAHDGTVAL
jgi:hypothetical protein